MLGSAATSAVKVACYLFPLQESIGHTTHILQQLCAEVEVTIQWWKSAFSVSI